MNGVLDLFSIGIGPSSSHTVGPMRAARAFAESLGDDVAAVRVELFGSLGATGRGHATDVAVVAGLAGARPESATPAAVDEARRRLACARCLLPDGRTARLELTFRGERVLPQHPNALTLTAFAADGEVCATRTYFSVGGGVIVEQGEAATAASDSEETVPFPFSTAAELLAHCEQSRLSISEVAYANEAALHTPEVLHDRLAAIAAAMHDCVEAGLNTDGILPGGLNVPRRAAALRRRLVADAPITDWLSVFAMAVNEENAAGGRVVTAPTNGAAGIVPAVLEYVLRFERPTDARAVERFLLCAGAIGLVIRRNASISGAEVGCQGEVGSACAMAAAALCEFLGGTPAQVENAAEIGMEHNLGLTCDPIGGLVQIPCIERNGMGAVKALAAARMALLGDGSHLVSFDAVIRTMRETGRDMSDRYKETSRGGLAVNVVEC